MTKKLLYLFAFFILQYYLTGLARDLSDISQGKQSFALFSDPQHQILRLVNSLVFCSCSFAGYLIFTKWYAARGLFKTITAFIVALLIIIMFKYLIEQVLCPYLFGFRNYPRNVSLVYYYLDSFSFCFYYSIWGLAFFFFDFLKQRELEKKEIQLQNRIAELSFLKAQVNPHFLFNSINNIYSLVATNPKAALPVLEQLSSLIRYMLYENQEQVPLKRELKYLLDYIELQKIRHSGLEVVKVNMALESVDLHIAPLLLLPFVENIFKHADPLTDKNKAIITITTQGRKLVLNTVNKKQQGAAATKQGIGLENVQRRLKLLYPDSYTLLINDIDGFYQVNLMIDL
ncbi:MAG: histidine kinase [Bacteroidota bacterium]|nr:histidine kinase [Bacteroidota bacterium]